MNFFETRRQLKEEIKSLKHKVDRLQDRVDEQKEVLTTKAKTKKH